jgi:hypothetical protein
VWWIVRKYFFPQINQKVSIAILKFAYIHSYSRGPLSLFFHLSYWKIYFVNNTNDRSESICVLSPMTAPRAAIRFRAVIAKPSDYRSPGLKFAKHRTLTILTSYEVDQEEANRTRTVHRKKFFPCSATDLRYLYTTHDKCQESCS